MTDLTALHSLLLDAASLDLTAVAQLFADSFDANGAILFVIEGSQLEVAGAFPPGGAVERMLRIPVGFGVTGLVARSGHSVTLIDDSPRNAAHRQLMGLGDGERVARLCVPARGVGGAVVAVVSVYRRAGGTFDESDLARAQRFADLLGLRIYAQGLLGAAEEHSTQRDRLIAQAVSAQEAERRRIAGDLHDGVTQALASLAFHLSAAASGLSGLASADASTTAALADIRAAKSLASLAYDETRAAISGLHSLLIDDLGLVAALESLAQSVPQLHVEFRGDSKDELGVIPDHVAAVLYRIAQEAINNCVKHADAQRAVLSLRRVGQGVVLGISDDGRGFDVGATRNRRHADSPGEHFGLSSIAERCALIGASLRIDSVQGRGTAVIVELAVDG